jgi:CelD/BcsL family acetyltransferase involved in cellulose biosynthesis
VHALKISEDHGPNGLVAGHDLRAGMTSVGSDLLEFSVARTFNFLSPEFAELFKRADATAFQNPIWLDCVFRRLASEHSTEILIGRTRADGRLILVLPMIRRQLGFLSVRDAADLNVSDYGAFVVDQGAASNPAVVNQIMDALRELTLVRVRRVRDLNIGFPQSDLRASNSAMDFKAHEVELAQPVGDWQSRILKPDFERFLKSKRKRLAAKGKITFEAASDPSRIRAAFEGMRHFRRSRWANDLLADSKHFEFYVDAAVSGHETGFTRTYVLSVNDTIVSALFGVWHKGRFSFLLSGFDREKFRNFSTGMLLLENVVEDCIRRADSCFDLTIGDEEYKQKFATRSVPMHVFWFGRRPWTSLAPLALDAAKRARSLIGKVRKFKIKAGAS